jgi:hypothetical protein
LAPDGPSNAAPASALRSAPRRLQRNLLANERPDAPTEKRMLRHLVASKSSTVRRPCNRKKSEKIGSLLLWRACRPESHARTRVDGSPARFANASGTWLGTFSRLFVATHPFRSRNFRFGSLHPLSAATPSDLVCLKNLERAAGIEPATYSLGSCRSTTELRPRKPCRV